MPTLVHSRPDTFELEPEIAALHRFMMLRLGEVERICPVAFDYLYNAASFLGASQGIETKLDYCDTSKPAGDPADLASYYAYCIPELEAIDLHVCLLTKIAVAIIGGHAKQDVGSLVGDLLFKDRKTA